MPRSSVRAAKQADKKPQRTADGPGLKLGGLESKSALMVVFELSSESLEAEEVWVKPEDVEHYSVSLRRQGQSMKSKRQGFH